MTFHTRSGQRAMPSMQKKIRQAQKRFELSDNDARFLVSGFALQRTAHLRQLNIVLRHGTPEQVKRFLELARQGKVPRRQIFAEVALKMPTRKEKAESKKKGLPVRTEQELMRLPKGEFGFALSRFRRDNNLLYAGIIAIAQRRLKEAQAGKRTLEKFDLACERLATLESFSVRNKHEWDNARTKFWRILNDYA